MAGQQSGRRIPEIFRFLKMFFYILCIYLFILCLCVGMLANHSEHVWRTEDNFKRQFSSFPMWVLEIEHRLSGLAAAPFPHWTASLGLQVHFQRSISRVRMLGSSCCFRSRLCNHLPQKQKVHFGLGLPSWTFVFQGTSLWINRNQNQRQFLCEFLWHAVF